MSGKTRRKKREELGLCIYCGQDKPIIGRKGCEICLSNKVEHTKSFARRKKAEMKEYRQRIKKEVLIKYGGKCDCCGEDNIEFLVIDHKNNDGNIERRKLYGKNTVTSYSWYLKLRREELRSDLRVLCHNCNMSMAFYGYCPHKGKPDKIQNRLVLTDNEIEIMLGLSYEYKNISEIVNTKSLIASLGSLVKKDLVFRETDGSYTLTKDGKNVFEESKGENEKHRDST